MKYLFYSQPVNLQSSMILDEKFPIWAVPSIETIIYHDQWLTIFKTILLFLSWPFPINYFTNLALKNQLINSPWNLNNCNLVQCCVQPLYVGIYEMQICSLTYVICIYYWVKCTDFISTSLFMTNYGFMKIVNKLYLFFSAFC